MDADKYCKKNKLIAILLIIFINFSSITQINAHLINLYDKLHFYEFAVERVK